MERDLVGRRRELAHVERLLLGGVDVIVVAGETGVGKTFFARHVATLMAARGWITAWVTCTRAAATIPLGAFFGLLSDNSLRAHSSLAMLRNAHADITALSHERRLLLVLDDADLLDDRSVVLARALVDDADVALLLTYRTQGDPAWIEDCNSSRGRVDIQLAPLSREAIRTLAEQTLGAKLTDELSEWAWGLSQGNAFFARELLLAALEADDARDHATVGNATPALPSRLQQVVARRLAGLTVEQRDILAVLALHEPISMDTLTAAVGDHAALEVLEDRALAVCTSVGRRREVGLGHPIYGEMLRQTMPRTRRDRLAMSLAHTIEALGCRRRDDSLVVARLRLTAGSADNPDLLLDAARTALALFDHEFAEDLARRALALGANGDADLVLGQALANRGEVAEAEMVLARIVWDDVDESVAVRGVLARAHNLLFSSKDGPGAQRLIEAALQRVTEPAGRDELEAALALCAGMLGDFRAASAAGVRVSQRSDMDSRAALSVIITSTLADAMLGRLSASQNGVERAVPLLPALRDELPFAQTQLALNQLFIHQHAGRLEEAEQLGWQQLGAAITADEIDIAALMGVNIAGVLLERGRCRDALELCLTSRRRLKGRSALGVEPAAMAYHARAAAAMGNLAAAAQLIEELSRHDDDLRGQVLGIRARTWLLAAQGRWSEAGLHAATAGREAMRTSVVVWAALALYDAVRCGRPELVAGDLRLIARDVEGALVPVLADHADAAVSRDAHTLDVVADEFRRMGAHAYAAEAAGQATAVHSRHGRPGPARRSASRASTEARRCQGRGFPLMSILFEALNATYEPLTTRELEIAQLAGRGLSSRQIADRLAISARTVDNHLSNVYRKAGIGGRHELPTALGLTQD